MAVLFSEKWMEAFGKVWNQDKEMVAALAQIPFDANIGYGFLGEPQPKGVLVVKNGQVVEAVAYRDQSLNWDLRATPADWQLWLKDGFGLAKLGVSVATGRLKFVVGDYRRMVSKLAMATPFLHSFELMSKVKTEL
ncbi:SCP-2 sterol transfer family protein [Gammaproteobacteria bacterium]